MPKYIFWRNAIVCEYFEIEADSEEDAFEAVNLEPGEPDRTEWIDWATGNFELESVEDELVTFLKSKDPKQIVVG